jgi:hypothetical protein
MNLDIGKQNLKFLVVDDEVAANESFQDDFISNIGLKKSLAKFAGNCEEALSILSDDRNLYFCLLDSKIPINQLNSPNLDYNGVNLIPKINAITNSFPIIVYSAYVENSELAERTRGYQNVITVKKNGSIGLFRNTVWELIRKILARTDIPSIGSSDSETRSTLKKIFDYDNLEPEVQQLIRANADKIKFLLKRTYQDYVEIGKYLTEVKQSLNHGQFYPWLLSEIGFSRTSAVRFMRAYNSAISDKSKSAKLADLDISPSVMYELNASTVPDEAVEETIELAKSGKKVTVEVVKSIKNKHIERKNAANKSDSFIDVVNNSLEQDADSRPTDKNNAEVFQPLFRQDIVKVISRQKVWKFGFHTLTCYDPNSKSFIKLLPESVSLVLAFPSHRNWNFEFQQYSSINIFQSNYDDLVYHGLFNSIKNLVETTTDYGDTVVLAFIPEPRVLLLLNKLGCRVFIAEPDYNKCLRLLELSQDII